MITNLPTELLRSFIAVVDAGSMVKATERVFVTPSAISLQIKRLEDLLQRPLFVRGVTRRLTLSPQGQEMLSYARQILDLNDMAVRRLRNEFVPTPIRIGVVQDFAETLLANTLHRFSARHGDVPLEVRTAESSALTAAFRDGDLDVVLAATQDISEDADVVKRVECVWVGDKTLAEETVLPLVLLDAPCVFRSMALKTLEKADKPYRIVVQTPHLYDLVAAVDGGLGITCRTAQFATHSQNTVIRSSLMPHLPTAGFALKVREDAHPAMADLESLIRETVAVEA